MKVSRFHFRLFLRCLAGHLLSRFTNKNGALCQRPECTCAPASHSVPLTCRCLSATIQLSTNVEESGEKRPHKKRERGVKKSEQEPPALTRLENEIRFRHAIYYCRSVTEFSLNSSGSDNDHLFYLAGFPRSCVYIYDHWDKEENSR